MGEYTPLALISLLSLIPLALYVAWTKRPSHAILIVAFFSTLFGPEGAFIKLPAVPPLDKTNLPFLVLTLVAAVKWRGAMKRHRAWRGSDLLVLVAIVGGFVTWQTNTDALRYGGWRITTIKGLAFNDGLQYGFDELLSVAMPFVLGRVFFRGRREVVELLRFLAVSTIVQSAFLLIELRLSPTWHIWVYGYGAHSDFLQTIRWGGYRPMNFMAHGLALALFVCVGFLAAVILWKTDVPIRKWRSKRVALALFVALVLCKSTGAIVFGAAFWFVLVRMKADRQALTALVIAAFVGLYPVLRAFDLLPTHDLIEIATDAFGADRAESLAFRFDNEELLLEKARERLWFGWGGHGRSSVYDDEMGKEISVADGHWIIVLGIRGVAGMVSTFGYLLIPLFVARRRLRHVVDERDRRLVAGLAVIVAMVTLDLVPNGLFATYPFLLAGALMGALQETRKQNSDWANPVVTS